MVLSVGDARDDVRGAAGQRAHELLLAVGMTLGDALNLPELERLLTALETGDLDLAATKWPEVRQVIVAAKE